MADLFGTEELEIKIKVITVDGKKMTKSMLSQILPEEIYTIERKKEPENSFLHDVKILGKPLGWVRIECPGYSEKHVLIWQKDGKLRKCNYRYKVWDDCKEYITKDQYELLRPIFEAPHLYIGA